MHTRPFALARRVIALVILAPHAALAYEPQLNNLTPVGGQRATTVEVTFEGPRVGKDPLEVILYEPGVTAGEIKAVDGNKTTAQLSMSEDCRLGRHAVRLRTASGISNLVTFHVGALPECAEQEPNNTPEQAQQIALNQVVSGIVDREDTDVFSVEVEAGQRLAVEVEGLRLGRTFFDPLIELVDPAGELITQSDDATAAFQDGFFSCIAEKAGRYVIRLREVAYRGDNRSYYRLHVGTFPRPTAVYPPAVVADQPSNVTWIGDATGDKAEEVQVAADTEAVIHCKDESGISPSGLTVLTRDTPPVLEAEPNNAVDQANAFAAPGLAAGVIQEEKDIDRFRVSLKKDQVWDLRVRARELRSSLDAVLRVRDAKGKQLAANDDDRGMPDSYLRFRVPADGDYVLEVEDRLRRGAKDFVYVIDAAPPQPIAEVTLEERRRYEATVVEVPRGGRAAVLLTVARRDFGGELRAEFPDLPPGVQAECQPLAGNFNRIPVIFSASEDAESASSLTPIHMQPVEEGKQLTTRFQQQTWLIRGRNNFPVWSHYADRAAVAVTDPLPFEINIDQPKAPIVRGGQQDLRIHAERKEGFEKPVSVRMLYHPPGVASNNSRSIPAKERDATIPVTANGNAALGKWTVTVIGELNDGGRVFTCTPFFTMEVVEPYFDMTLPTVAARQGDSVEMPIELNQRTPFDGAARLELIRLPPGVTSAPIEVTKDDKTATFHLTIDGQARPGRHRGVSCQARLTINGEPVIYTQAYVDVQIDRVQKPAQTAMNPGQSKGSS